VTALLIAAAIAAAQGGPPAGEQIYRRHCQGCHALEPGRNTPAGPTLHGVVGRAIAAQPGFDYSPAMRRFGAGGARWTPQQLDRFLVNPERAIPGTEMGAAGIAAPAERRALIDWLGRRARPAR
jgi:cytochrome c